MLGIYRTIDLWKIAGVIFVWTKWGTLAPKMPFAARFSCCAMVVLTSPVKCQKSKSQKRVKISNVRTKSLKVRALLAGVVKLPACKPTVSS